MSDNARDRLGGAARDRLLRQGVWLAAGSVAWNIIEGCVAVTAGVLASSVALIGFGIDSFIETTSAVVVGRAVSGATVPRYVCGLCGSAFSLKPGERLAIHYVGRNPQVTCPACDAGTHPGRGSDTP